MARSIRELAQEVVASPLGDIIAAVGRGVAAAQQALDDASVAKTLEIYHEGGDEAARLLREIGYRPTFYALPETTGEVRVSLALGSNASPATTTVAGAMMPVGLTHAGRVLGRLPNLYATPVDAGYANRYGYRAQVSSKITFRIVPVPAPNGADELRLVPDLIGRGIAEAVVALEALGLLPLTIDDSGAEVEASPTAIVTSQTPPAATLQRLGDTVRLSLSG